MLTAAHRLPLQDPLALPVARELFWASLAAPLLERFQDEVGTNRELAVVFVTDFCKVLLGDSSSKDGGGGGDGDGAGGEQEDLTPLMDMAVPSISQRLGTEPYPEASEEIRVQLLDLLKLFIASPPCAKNLRRHLSDIVNVLVKASRDKFPEAKRTTSATEMMIL